MKNYLNLFLILSCTRLVESLNKYAPVWVTSPYIKSDSANVIGNKTGNSSTPSATIPFPGAAFTLIPNIGYGAFNYEGDDGLASQMFEINRTSVTTSSFSVLIQITGYTNINLLAVRFVAIDKNFPHSVNSYDNVPANYSAGPFTGISDQTSSINTYQNTINFTQLSSGMAYNQFRNPLSKNKILLFITSFFLTGIIDAVGQTNPALMNIVVFHVDYQILTNQTFQLQIKLGVLNKLDRLHFSMIIFYEEALVGTSQYMLVYQRFDITRNGGFIKIPSQFVNNFMLGLTNFTSQRTRSIVFYSWSFTTYNGDFGLLMPLSVPYNLLVPAVNSYGFTYFYIKTWDCPVDTFFEDSDNTCTECPIINCINCFNQSICQVCDFANNYIANETSGLCQLCALEGCINCTVTNLTFPPSQRCYLCDSSNHYRLVGTTCQHCQTSLNYFLNTTTMTCQLCTLLNCVLCSSFVRCLTCDYNNSYGLNTVSGTCEYCNSSQDIFVNLTSYACQACSLSNCLNCLSLTQCQICNTASGYFLNPNTSLCQLCTLSNCLTCSSLTACSVCDTSYVKNPTTLLCQACSDPNCNICSSVNICTTCDSGYLLNTNNNTCQVCSIPNCNTCVNLTWCSVCNSPYFTNSIGNCQLCSLSNCLTCASLTACSVCNNAAGYFINPSNLCQSCTLSNCITCASLTACSVCDTGSGFFLNSTSNLCQACTLSNCITCTSLTACSVCDTANGYFLNSTSGLCELCALTNCLTCASLTSCSVCDTGNGYFLNSTSGLCEPCSIPHCLTCSSLTACSLCNETSDHFLNSSNLCDPCSLSNCLDCHNSSVCLNCSLPYLLNGTSSICEACTLTNCLTCSTLTSCSVCNTGYFLNPNTTLCQACFLSNCITCASLTACSVCDTANQYFLNSSNLCESCSLSNCITCASLTACSVCDTGSGFFLNLTSNLCEACALSSCITCASLTACSVCDTANGYFLNSTSGLCELCSLSNCLTCASLTSCSVCDTGNGYFLNATSGLCQFCTIPHCLTCSSLTTCSLCNQTSDHFLNGSSLCDPCSIPYCLDCHNSSACIICNNVLGYFINSSNSLCQPCAVPHCLTCSSLTLCSVCDEASGYFLNSTNSQCEPCPITNCTQCLNLTYCDICDLTINSVLNYSSGLCEYCPLQGCVKCESIDVCQICDLSNLYGHDWTTFNRSQCGGCNVSCVCDGYYQPWDHGRLVCSSVCGDGLIRVDEECDDNNTDSTDGCSSLCRIEPYSVCSGQPSICNVSAPASVPKWTLSKQNCNQFKLKLDLQGLGYIYTQTDISIANSDVTTKSVKLSQVQKVQILAQYFKSLVNQRILVKINQQIFQIQYSQVQPLLFYTEQQCKTKDEMDDVVDAVVILSYITLLTSLVSVKIVGLELFGFLQLAYYSLISYDFLVLYLEPLAKFKIFNGFNTEVFPETDQRPQQFKFIGFSTNFSNNCNVMFLVMLGQLVSSFCLYIISRIIQNQKLKTISLRLLKQGFLTLFIFNVLNISFSSGTHFKFLQNNSQLQNSLALAAIVSSFVIGIGVIGAFLWTESKDYGEFNNKFKDTMACRIYVPLTIAYRAAIGIYTSSNYDQMYSTLIVIAFSIFFILYNIINLPFKDAAQNYRSNYIHVCQLVTLLTANYYRSMKATTPLQIKGYIFLPAIIQLVLAVLAVVLSLSILVYEIVKEIQIFMRKKSINNENLKKESKNLTQESQLTIS